MPRSALVGIYLGVSRLSGGLASHLVRKRLKAGKEDPDRYPERLGRTARKRPDGPLLWFHAASVGEALALIDLIDHLVRTRPDLHVMITTVTRTSAEILASRLPDRAFHQFAPVDSWPVMGRFLDHWQPDLAVWTESELWPTMICRTRASGADMLLINARMSDRSFKRLRKLGRYPASLLSRFSRILVPDDAMADRLWMLGMPQDRLQVTGSLKGKASPLPADPADLARLSAAVGERKIWCAASTHTGEEVLVAKAHHEARKTLHRLLLLLVPRHPDRGDAIAQALRNDGWTVAQRSKGEMPDATTDIYLADTIGEMGLWYRLAPVSFVGGSLVEIGGHNPYEPALLGSAVLTGPHIENFTDPYASLREAGGVIEVPSADDLAAAVVKASQPDVAARMAEAGWEVCSKGDDVIETVANTILDHLPPGPDQ